MFCRDEFSFSKLAVALKQNEKSLNQYLPIRNSIIQYVMVRLRYVYTLRLIGPISYLGACYIHTKVTKCIREKIPLLLLSLNH